MALQDYPLLVRGSLTLALSLAALGAGCRAPQAATPQAAPATPAIAPGTGASPKAAASPTAEAEPSPDAEPLPLAALDSDLEPGDQAAIEGLLDSDALESYLPSDLINDGGVILYQTLQVREPRKDQERADKGKGVQSDEVSPLAPPARWARQNVERSGRQAQLRRQVGPGGKRAQVVIRYEQRGQFVFQDAAAPKGFRRKNFRQKFERTLRFGLQGQTWTLLDFSPVRMESKDGHSGLDVQGFQIFKGDASAAAVTVSELDRFVTPTEVPTFKPGETLRAEVAMKSRKGAGAFMFAHVVGANDRAKQMLLDDGTHGDRVAGDGIYTGTFVVPAGAGTRHFGIDVLDPAVFTANGRYQANTLGLTFKVEKP